MHKGVQTASDHCQILHLGTMSNFRTLLRIFAQFRLREIVDGEYDCITNIENCLVIHDFYEQSV